MYFFLNFTLIMQLSINLTKGTEGFAKNGFHGLICLLLLVHPYLMTRDLAVSIRPFMIIQQLNTLFIIIPIYLVNVVVFVPQLVRDRKLGSYLFSVMVALVIAIVVGAVLNQLLLEKEQLGFSFYVNGKHHIFNNPPPFRFIVMMMCMALAVGTGFEIIQDWGKQEKAKEALAKEKVVSELSYLKSQINPHFLFNSLNSIYYLASMKSEDTQKAVLLLSDLMRYVLYDSATHTTALTKEINHLENYITLQKLRISTKKNVQVHFSQNGDFSPFTIEPLLLIPFVENAFKHGISYKEPSYIIIQVATIDDELQATIANSKHPNKPMKPNRKGGIGLQNVQKRLKLLYPNTGTIRHELLICDTPEEYRIDLTLKLR